MRRKRRKRNPRKQVRKLMKIEMKFRNPKSQWMRFEVALTR